jgi:hypothetical protein
MGIVVLMCKESDWGPSNKRIKLNSGICRCNVLQVRNLVLVEFMLEFRTSLTNFVESS